MSTQNREKLIMIVEDNERNMKLTAELLELNRFKVLKAASGEAAWECLKMERPDLILLDIKLPGISGIEVYKKIRQEPRLVSIRIVAFTASVMSEQKKEILGMGFNGFIAKPIDIDTFIGEINTFLER